MTGVLAWLIGVINIFSEFPDPSSKLQCRNLKRLSAQSARTVSSMRRGPKPLNTKPIKPQTLDPKLVEQKAPGHRPKLLQNS